MVQDNSLIKKHGSGSGFRTAFIRLLKEDVATHSQRILNKVFLLKKNVIANQKLNLLLKSIFQWLIFYSSLNYKGRAKSNAKVEFIETTLIHTLIVKVTQKVLVIQELSCNNQVLYLNFW